jgi:hypothetical protein
MRLLVAFRPFLEPIPLGGAALLLGLPVVVLVALTIKTLQLDDFQKLPVETAVLAAQIALFLAGVGALLWALSAGF